jgi:hypothetical protein
VRHARRWKPAGAVAIGLAAAGIAVGCMRAGGVPRFGTAPPRADSVTVGLWRMDETHGTDVVDAGLMRLHGGAGIDTPPDFGRFGSARRFQRTIESFVFVPFHSSMNVAGSFTVEAWVRPDAVGQYEDTPWAARWTQEANQQSWLFGMAGQRLLPPIARLPSPGFHLDLVTERLPGHVLFAFQPEEAGPPRAFFSTRPIEMERWTHVAVSYDGLIIRFFVNGLLEAQYASRGSIRPTTAPLLIGNYFDPRRLSGFGGDLRVDPGGDRNPYYAFEGLIDELRISNVARSDFPTEFQR